MLARRDDPDRVRPGHRLSNAYTEVGRRSYQWRWGCGTRRAGQPAWHPRPLSRFLDFRAGYDSAHWPGLWEEFFCDWRELWFNQRVEPPSWVLADDALAAGAKGILFASRFVPGGTNLVVYNDMLTADDALQVYDPSGALPKNQDSWR